MQTSFSFCRSAFTIFVPMKSAIELFSALGRRLADFGGDAPTQEVAERACRANGWFTPAEVCRAVRTLSRDMLQRPKLERWLAAYPAEILQAVAQSRKKVESVFHKGKDNTSTTDSAQKSHR